MKFTLLGKTIEISEGRKNYMKILTFYKSMAAQAEIDFSLEYDNIFGMVFLNSTWAEKFKKTYGSGDYMDNIVMRYVAKTRQFLANYGVYNLSDSVIWNEGIVSDDRDVSRLQYELNSYIIECVSRDEDDDNFISRLKSKFSGSFFPNCLYNDIMSLCDFVLNYLDDNKIAEIQFVYKQDAEKASAYYSNLMDTVVTEEDELKLLESVIDMESSKAMEILQHGVQKSKILSSNKEQLAYALIDLDPRNKSYYEYIFENFSYAKYEIAAIAKFLSIDLSDLIEKEIRRDFDLKSISNEDDALKMMDDLKLSMEKFCVTSSSRKTELEKILHDFDIKARTYDGILYDTRELCSQAEKDDQALFEMHGDIDSIDKDACSLFLTEIVHMQCTAAVKNKHLQLLNDRITAIYNEYLGNLLSAVEVSDEAECNRPKDVINQYDAPAEIKSPYIARVEKRIYTIWDAEDFARFSEIFVQTQVSNSEQVVKNCTLIRDMGRTETKELFIKAFYLLNDTEVEAAAKYAVAKEGGLFASLINMGKKETYEILTLGGRIIHPAIQTAMEAVKAKKGNGILSSFGFGKNKSKQQPMQTQSPIGAKFCSACGAKTDGVSKFCSNCGNNKLN